jgi:hypothetical protein
MLAKCTNSSCCAIVLLRVSVRSLLEWLDANGSYERRQHAQDL